jgi:hypothetical protein
MRVAGSVSFRPARIGFILYISGRIYLAVCGDMGEADGI